MVATKSDPELYRLAKANLLRAAMAYAKQPSEGTAHVLKVQARAFTKTREDCGIVTNLDVECHS